MAAAPPEGGEGASQEGVGGSQATSEMHQSACDVTEPERLLCPITHIMYRDPCFVPESGNTYERLAVERYWDSTFHPRDPLTNLELNSRALHPNWGVRREVQRFLEEVPDYTPQGWPDRKVPPPAESSARSAGMLGGLSARAFSSRRWLHLAAVVLALLAALLLYLQLATGGHGATAAPARRPRGGNATVLHPPKGSLLEAWTEDDHLLVYVAPRGFSMDLAGQLFFASFWTGFTALWTMAAVQNGAPVMFAMFSLPFWGVGLSLMASVAKAPFESELLDLGMGDYSLSKDWLRFSLSSTTGPIADLSEPPLRQCEDDQCELVFKVGLQEISFGGSLHAVEAKWVQEIVQRHLVATSEGERFNVQLAERTVDRSQLPSSQRRSQSGGFHFGVVIR